MAFFTSLVLSNNEFNKPELKNDDRNAEAVELARELQISSGSSLKISAAVVLIDMFSSTADRTRIECAEVVGSTPTLSISFY
jgi:hypothetical protein